MNESRGRGVYARTKGDCESGGGEGEPRYPSELRAYDDREEALEPAGVGQGKDQLLPRTRGQVHEVMPSECNGKEGFLSIAGISMTPYRLFLVIYLCGTQDCGRSVVRR